MIRIQNEYVPLSIPRQFDRHKNMANTDSAFATKAVFPGLLGMPRFMFIIVSYGRSGLGRFERQVNYTEG